MRITRSSKCSLKFLTDKKRQELGAVLDEYGKVVNHFIDMFWDKAVVKAELFKDVVNSPDSWLSARLKKVAAREALDMIFAAKERWKDKPAKMVKPTHKGNRMYVSCTIADLKQPKKAKEFDFWLELRSIGTWNVRYWLGRLQMDCESSRATFRSVSPFKTSITCHACGHVDGRSRDGTMFRCTACGHADNADLNASRNIVDGFLAGPYGACYKLADKSNFVCLNGS